MDTENELLRLAAESPPQLSAYVNNLIETDFSRLVQLLYRLDVSEDKLKKVLLENAGGDAGSLIADLIAERILQSKKTKEQFQAKKDIPEDEKW